MKSCLATIALLVFLASCSSMEPRPPLIQGLTGSRVSADFDQRIQSRFPVGSSAQVLAAELKDEGFSLSSSSVDSEGRDVQAVGRLEYLDFPCEDDWIVSWHATAGNITEVHGEFGMTCP